MTERVDALSYHLERTFGRKVPQCAHCGSLDLYERYDLACWHCNGCGWDVAGQTLRFVPQDERVRRPEEFDRRAQASTSDGEQR